VVRAGPPKRHASRRFRDALRPVRTVFPRNGSKPGRFDCERARIVYVIGRACWSGGTGCGRVPKPGAVMAIFRK
jgi:hypothetical protein